MLMRRYFAFILMLLSVVANTSQGHTAAYADRASIGAKLVFVSKLNEIISSNIQKANISVKKQNMDKKGFGDILGNNVTNNLSTVVTIAAAFIFCFLFINNGIVKNSIWKSTVF